MTAAGNAGLIDASCVHASYALCYVRLLAGEQAISMALMASGHCRAIHPRLMYPSEHDECVAGVMVVAVCHGKPCCDSQCCCSQQWLKEELQAACQSDERFAPSGGMPAGAWHCWNTCVSVLCCKLYETHNKMCGS
jgi:hypothetical protein